MEPLDVMIGDKYCYLWGRLKTHTTYMYCISVCAIKNIAQE